MYQLSRRLTPATCKQVIRSLSSAEFNTHQALSVGPSVRLLLNLYGIDASEVTSTGPHGRLLKGDVLSYINSRALEPKPFSTESPSPSTPQPTSTSVSLPISKTPISTQTVTYDDEEPLDLELTNMRKTIAKRLTMSKSSIPHTYSTVDCDVTRLINTRKNLSKDGYKVSVNDFIVKACAVALTKMPVVNSSFDGNEGRPLPTVDIAVAVATENGLITPIVEGADGKSVNEISNKVKELAAKAREGKLLPREFQGGSFTISNLGMYGIKEFTAVINPPQSCILAVGSTQISLSNDCKPIQTLTITLSADSRVVDHVDSAEFLSLVKNCLENPQLLLL